MLEAADGVDALGFCVRQAGPIHLLLVDAALPNMSGAALAKRLSPARPQARVLYMCGKDADVPSLGLGPADPVIRKPFAPVELLDRVRRLLDSRQVSRPRRHD